MIEMAILCERCRDLVEYPRHYGQPVFLSVFESRCPLCQQLKTAIDTIMSNRIPSVPFDSGFFGFLMTNYPALPETCGTKWDLGFVGRTRCLQFFPDPGSMGSCSHSPKHKSLVRPVVPDKPDFEFVRASIEECRRHHVTCAKQSPAVRALRLIDCRTRRLVVPKGSHPYICLSYVWGSGPVEELDEGDELPKNLPKTIEDTLFVALKLDISFVWVDRYCIDQKDSAEKHDIIQSMDRVYQGAELTVIAIGADPNDGLPGVRGSPRVPQCRLDIGNKTFLGVPIVTSEIKESKWNARAWSVQSFLFSVSGPRLEPNMLHRTFQESLLSPRRLVFTSSQMYFQCYEDFHLEGVRPDTSLLKTFFTRDYPVFPVGKVGRQPEDLSKLLNEYYKRQLSFNTDTIHAITGIINNFQCEPHAAPPITTASSTISFSPTCDSEHPPEIATLPAKNFYGLPVIHYARHADGLRQSFLHYLQWTVHTGESYDPPPPSDLFPSWSWASHKANNSTKAINYLNMPPMMGARPGYGKTWNYLGIEIDVSHVKDGPMSITQFHNHTDDYMSFAPRIDITTWTLEVKLETSSSKVYIMSDYHSIPDWATRSQAKLLAVCLSLGVQSTHYGHPDQLLVNGLLVVETEPGVYRRIKPFHTGRLMTFMDMAAEQKRAWNAALKVMDSNDEIVVGMKQFVDEGWVGPAVLEKLPIEPWRKETIYLV